MTFAKGNQLWKEGFGVRMEKRQKIDQFLLILADGGMERYADIMDKLARNEELTASEREFMDRMEKWTEYIRPKLARNDSNIQMKGDVIISVNNYERSTDIPPPPISVEDTGRN